MSMLNKREESPNIFTLPSLEISEDLINTLLEDIKNILYTVWDSYCCIFYLGLINPQVNEM